ncbi:probable LRR receptor-like serine/threonine-protein kinase At1g53430 isoform X4 [Vitis vinifera]|uniref:probable LRR receptor-like serine/threonine-protein kinase At1g53430 isoform X4 n=1 Tax=Vitis vinifera TaxID=29760 RepID=UPI0008FF8385|nr:probable LRR receptor-like serine/threonine-protein kinase At1g53430 isoform X4 [Vitis vinifera]|eukprot:XP_019077769.1 PREDICTED: probable LRR receptor-like serine/threonine-protein kinase At1g53430 [Vitis vinifera]
MKPRKRVGLQSPSRRRIQSLDIMTSCSSLLIQTTWNLSGRSRCLQFWNCCLGRSNTTYRPKEECIYRLDWALIKREGEFDGSSRPQIGLRLQQGRDHLIVMINIALLCTNVSPAVRPATPSVVNMLEGRIAVQDICF